MLTATCSRWYTLSYSARTHLVPISCVLITKSFSNIPVRTQTPLLAWSAPFREDATQFSVGRNNCRKFQDGGAAVKEEWRELLNLNFWNEPAYVMGYTIAPLKAE
jgi:hypothetical protein